MAYGPATMVCALRAAQGTSSPAVVILHSLRVKPHKKQ